MAKIRKGQIVFTNRILQLRNAASGYNKDPVCFSVNILLSKPIGPLPCKEWSNLSLLGHAQDAINRGSQGI